MEETRTVDLHCHTTASDGTYTPTELILAAKSIGLAAVAITDHDTVAGHEEALQAGRENKIDVVPGIEFSTSSGGTVHILGYYVDHNSDTLVNATNWIVHERDDRNERICELMRADGLKVEYEEMKAQYGEVIGRPHFAVMLVKLGVATDVQDAFRRYMNKGEKYFLRRRFLPLIQTISVIRQSGGIPVLAHPFQYKRDDEGLRDLIRECVDLGLQGMECYYSGYTPEQQQYLADLANAFGLLKTGGSDFHGANKSHIRLGTGINGTLSVPYSLYVQLRTTHQSLS